MNRLQTGTDITTIQSFLGHNDVPTSMIYIHVLRQGEQAVKTHLIRWNKLPDREPDIIYGV